MSLTNAHINIEIITVRTDGLLASVSVRLHVVKTVKNRACAGAINTNPAHRRLDIKLVEVSKCRCKCERARESTYSRINLCLSEQCFFGSFAALNANQVRIIRVVHELIRVSKVVRDIRPFLWEPIATNSNI